MGISYSSSKDGTLDFKAYFGHIIPIGGILNSEEIFRYKVNRGLGLGFEISVPVMQDLAVINNISFAYNPPYEDDDWDYIYSYFYDGYCKTETDNWYYLPISTGLSYNFLNIGKVKFNCLFMASLNINKVPDFYHEHKYDSIFGYVDYKYSTDTHKGNIGTSLGFVFGLDILINKRYIVSIRYNNFGKNSADVIHTHYRGDDLSELVLIYEEKSWRNKIKVSFVMLNFGIKIN